mgnify:FL=1
MRSILFILIPSLLGASVLFEDDFSNEVFSTLNWVARIDDGGSAGFSDGAASIDNASIVYSAMLVHNMPQKSPDFTFSGKVVSIYPGAGLLFCLRNTNEGADFYAVMTGDGSVFAYRYSRDGATLISSKESPFVRKAENQISVSKRGERISVFCNGYFIFSFIDSELESGDIGLLVQPYISASFDDVVFRDETIDSTNFTCFRDDFRDTAAFGWTRDGSGDAVAGDSVLRVTTTAYQDFFYGLEIPLANFCMKTTVNLSGSDSGSLCGLFVLSGNTNLFFCVNGKSQYSVYSYGQDPELEPVDRSESEGIYTLELKKENGELQFLVNGLLVESKPAEALYHKAGLYTSSRALALFNDFELLDPDGCGHFTSVKFSRVRKVYRTRGGIETDILGRKINFRNSSLLFIRTGNQEREKGFRLRAGSTERR